MKGVRGKLLKKLDSVRPIGYLNQDRLLHAKSPDGFVAGNDSPSKTPVLQEKTNLRWKSQEQSKLNQKQQSTTVIKLIPQELEIIEDEESEIDDGFYEDKENMGSIPMSVNLKERSISFILETEQEQSVSQETEHVVALSEIDVSSFRRPDLNSGSLFDPNLLAAFGQAVRDHIRMVEEERRARIEKQSEEEEEEQEPPLKSRRIEMDPNQNQNQNFDPIFEFEENCPPGGDGAVILYTTTLQGIRKTFEDCNRVRSLLEALRVVFFERDVSMHGEYKEELRRALGGGAVVVPPKLFVKGRYIGGAEEVLELYEQGKLRHLLDGVPIDRSEGPCEGCDGVRFVLCFRCSGSRRKVSGDDGLWGKCPECNENGLMICPFCC